MPGAISDIGLTSAPNVRIYAGGISSVKATEAASRFVDRRPARTLSRAKIWQSEGEIWRGATHADPFAPTLVAEGDDVSFDFGALERLWLTSIEEAMRSLELAPGARLYAIAFWLFYADEEEWLRRCVDEPLPSALFPNLSWSGTLCCRAATEPGRARWLDPER
jgi:hypothetical protein